MATKKRKAHQEKGKADMLAYGFIKKTNEGNKTWLTESEIVEELMKLYAKDPQ